MRTLLSSIGFLSLLVLAGAQSFTYQGFLRVSGTPANGAYDFEFRLFTAASGGTQVGSTVTVNDLNVQNGLFTVELNFGSVWDGSDRYLEIRVRPGASTGAYTTLTPRVKITRTPYAARADAAPPVGIAGGDLSGSYPNPTVARLQGRVVSTAAPVTGQVLKWDGSAWAPSADLRDAFWQASGSNIFYNAGNVGIGTSSPASPLHVVTDTAGSAIYISHTATGGASYGVYALSSSTEGIGVFGRAIASSGWTYGIYGISDSTSGTGVYGYVTATSGYTAGGMFESRSPDGRGVVGWAIATTGVNHGGLFVSNSTIGRGVRGIAIATSGVNYGVYGESRSPDGYGGYFVGAGYFSGNVGIGTTPLGHRLTVTSPDTNTLRLIGPGLFGSTAKLNFGDEDYVYLQEDLDDRLTIYSSGRTAIMGGNVGIGTTTPAVKLHVVGDRIRLEGSGKTLDLRTDGAVVDLESRTSTLFIRASSGTAGSNDVVINPFGTDGNVGIGITTPAVKLHVNGTARVNVLEIVGADFAEKFPTTDTVEPGMVVEIDPDNPGNLRKARGAYNKRVVGVVAGANGLSKGIILGNLEGSENHTPVAMSGRVWVYADATDRAIEPGDFLTTAEKPGYAMAVDDLAKAQGAIIGKAMTRLEKGKTGLVLVVVNLQ